MVHRPRLHKRTHRMPLSLQNYGCLQDYIKKVNQSSQELKLKTFLPSIKVELNPYDFDFKRYKRIMASPFKITRVGGSFNPKREFVIIETTNNQKLKLVKYPDILKLIFPDRSIFQVNYHYHQGDENQMILSSPRFFTCKLVSELADSFKRLSLDERLSRVVPTKEQYDLINGLSKDFNKLNLSNNLSNDASSCSSEDLSPFSERASTASTKTTFSVMSDMEKVLNPGHLDETVKEIMCPSATPTVSTVTNNTPLYFDDC